MAIETAGQKTAKMTKVRVENAATITLPKDVEASINKVLDFLPIEQYRGVERIKALPERRSITALDPHKRRLFRGDFFAGAARKRLSIFLHRLNLRQHEPGKTRARVAFMARIGKFLKHGEESLLPPLSILQNFSTGKP